MVALSVLLFLPFYLNFNSPAQGIGLLPANMRSSLGDELLIYGLFAFVFLSLLISGVLKRPLFDVVPRLAFAGPAGDAVVLTEADKGAAPAALEVVDLPTEQEKEVVRDEHAAAVDDASPTQEAEQKKTSAVLTEEQSQALLPEEEKEEGSPAVAPEVVEPTGESSPAAQQAVRAEAEEDAMSFS